jgi:hypothetical protein
MKKLLCIAMALIMILAAVFVVPASADDTLTITAGGKIVGTVKVGSEFLYRIGLYAGEKKVLNGQAHLDYDSTHLSFVPHTASYVDDDGETVSSVDVYSFPAKIRNASLVLNTEYPGQINYNFTKSDGIAAFNDSSKLFARFRFIATRGGTADITNTIAYMIDVNEQQIYYKEQASTTINPYQTITIETPVSLIGDANGDNKITILDATVIQRAAAGVETSYISVANADTSCDGKVTLRDAMYIKQYLANLYTGYNVGSGIYSSEI